MNVRKFFRETRREGEEARRDRRDDQNIRVFNSPKGEERRSGGGEGEGRRQKGDRSNPAVGKKAV